MKVLPRKIALPVSLNRWTISASIDFLTLTNLSDDQRHVLRDALAASGARVKLSDKGRPVITIHDPAVHLQAIIDIYPNASIYAVEFSVDLRPVGEIDVSELVPVYRWIADTLYPATPKAQRYMFDLTSWPRKQYVKAPAGPCEAITTIIWRNVTERVKQRLYIKDRDGNGPFERPCVRLEATFSMTECSNVRLAKVWQLATFGNDLRRVLSPCFQIANGIKPKIKRTRHKVGSEIDKKTRAYNDREVIKTDKGWTQGGAMWAANQDYKVSPNHEARRRIGDALHRLGKQLTKLKLPENSREVMEWVSPENRMLLEVDDYRASLPIRGESIQYKCRGYRKTLV